jgi:hypothetical protein
MPKINATANIGIRQFLNACTDTELRQLARLIKKDPYRTRINEQLTIFNTTK